MRARRARQLLTEAQARRRLPVLDDLRIAAPCRTDWDAMLGDERVRFCARCEKNVYNLSAMTRGEAEALLLANEGQLCVRYYRRHDGTILTTDCPIGTRRRSRRRRLVAAAFGAMSALTAAGAAWFARPWAQATTGVAATVADAPALAPVAAPPAKAVARGLRKSELGVASGGPGACLPRLADGRASPRRPPARRQASQESAVSRAGVPVPYAA